MGDGMPPHVSNKGCGDMHPYFCFPRFLPENTAGLKTTIIFVF